MSSNLTRGLQQSIDNTAITDGKLRFAVDTARLFLDLESERIEITDIIKGLTYSEIVALTKPLPKVYLSSDTHQILSYDYNNERWIVYGESAINKISYDNDGNTIVEYNNGSTDTIINPVITELRSEIEELRNMINNL